MKMKAFIYTKQGEVSMQEAERPVLDEKNEADRRAALLKPRYLSPCSSDVHTVYAGAGPRRPGLILGHEGLAEIVALGSEVKGFSVGELVAVSAVMPDVPGGTGHEGAPFSGSKLGRNINGMWAECFKVPDAAENLAHIPEGVQPEQALMAVDVMATGFTAAKEAGIRPGQTVAVIGTGAIGLMAIAAAKLSGAAKVIAIGSERRARSIELARSYGADLYLSYQSGAALFGRTEMPEDRGCEKFRSPLANATESPAVASVLNRTKNQGVDAVLICGGGYAALAQACDLARYGTGVVVNVEYIEGSGMIGLPIFSLGRGMAGKTFRFVLCRGGRAVLEEMLGLIADGRIDPGALVTHRLSGFERIADALSMMRTKPDGLMKLMLSVEDAPSGNADTENYAESGSSSARTEQ